VNGIFALTACGPACWEAREEVCRCSCGGVNHGIHRHDGECKHDTHGQVSDGEDMGNGHFRPVGVHELAMTKNREAGIKYRYAHTARQHLDSSRICHSTGKNNAINRRTGKPEAICRGAREVQLKVFAAMGVITAATDEAWAARCRAQGLPEPELVD